MKYRSWIVAGTAVAAALCSPQTAIAEAVDFQQDILPLLADRCFACHGPDANQRKADLRLDQEDGAKKEVLVAGDPDASELLRRIITSDPDDKMPPPESEKAPLTGEQIERFRTWIAEGAPWEGHWAYATATASTPPAVSHPDWPREKLDNFILARLESEGLTPAPEADKATLIRRLTLDLTGLPPTLAEIDRFLMDNSERAYEDLVDRLLASPNYGEHMARTWLDNARYADTNGHQNDFHRVMWPWRDWVIDVFNDNMPYDQFVVEQLAGDLLPNATESQRVATGFNRNNKSVTEGGSIEEEWLVENLVDRVETTSTAFLGLTMGCARCHDHKYDPIKQRDFFQFYAFFNSTEDKGFYNETRGNVGPQVHLPSFAQQQALNKLDQALNQAHAALEAAKVGDYEGWLAGLRQAVPATDAATPSYALPLDGELPASGVTAVRAPRWEPGILGAAYGLDGNAESTLDLGQAVIFDREKPFTLAAWVRPDGGGAIFSKMDEGAAYRGVDTFVTGNGELATHIISEWDGNAINVVTEKVLAMGVWAHVAVTYDGSSKAAGVIIYVNGTPVSTKVVKDGLSGPIDTAEPVRLGQRTRSLYLKGAIAHLQVFDQVLTGEMIATDVEDTLAAALPEDLGEEQALALRKYADHTAAIATAPQQQAVEAAQKARDEYAKKIPSVMVMQERETPRPTYLLKRGAYDAPDTSEQLYPNTPDFLPAMAEGQPRNRLGLAQWLVDPQNPLTARVAVNRYWHMIFGRGLVKTSEDFGVQGSPPSHPRLLDTLAVDFVASGWDVKGLLKELVMSATYRQASALNETLLAKDPENRLLGRGSRYRLSAEMIRDNALSVSGLLAKQLGGPPAMPYQPAGLWEELAGGASQGPYTQGTGDDIYRRSIYTHRKRTVPHPTLASFDAPSFEYCLARRARTNTPLQALTLLNDTTYVEAARHLAERMLRESEGDARERVAYGFRLVTGRAPTASELEALVTGYEGYAAHYGADVEASKALLSNGESPVPTDIAPEALAAYVPLAGVLLNLDETLTRE